MRDDAKIMRLTNLREKSRQLFMESGDVEHLHDMNTIKHMIEIEKNKETRLLSRVLLGVVVAVPIAIILMWRFSSGT